jgi:hypothetical protein
MSEVSVLRYQNSRISEENRVHGNVNLLIFDYYSITYFGRISFVESSTTFEIYETTEP